MNKVVQLYTDTEGTMYLSDGVTMWDVTDSETTMQEDAEAIANGKTGEWTVPTFTFDEMSAMREHPFTTYNEFVIRGDKTSIYDIG